ncbi:hypothetical protein QMM95_05590 [Leptospira santarosai]|uniref:hypothetical protein n=1 Tax=Leptospira santarosai TaxID=28183 RepID=UPI0024AED075|nr:hypothetical protein [Leptospira santarosai]MDI7235565.1 hypothetical protein [Leptospira santarosai]
MRSRIRSFHKFVIKRKNPAVFLGVLSTSERIFASFDSYNVVVPHLWFCVRLLDPNGTFLIVSGFCEDFTTLF